MNSKKAIEFEQVVERGCGMDVQKEIIVATIQGEDIKTQTKSYKKFTSSLIKLKEWILKSKITRVAMEITGVY